MLSRALKSFVLLKPFCSDIVVPILFPHAVHFCFILSLRETQIMHEQEGIVQGFKVFYRVWIFTIFWWNEWVYHFFKWWVNYHSYRYCAQDIHGNIRFPQSFLYLPVAGQGYYSTWQQNSPVLSKEKNFFYNILFYIWCSRY